MMKKILLLSFFLILPLLCLAPSQSIFVIEQPEKVNPFLRVMEAVCKVESSGDTLAYNAEEKAYGCLQIRHVRRDDYYKRTGKYYEMEDFYRPSISNEVFLYYASQIGPYDIERVVRNWNGKWELTESYWLKVKKYLS